MPLIERHAVSGRFRFLPSVVKESCVSPKPWRRMRMLMGEPVDGGFTEKVREGEKSDFWGRRGRVIVGGEDEDEDEAIVSLD